jgi:hypothetical protein
MKVVDSFSGTDDPWSVRSAGEIEFDVLRTLWAERSSLTKRQLEARTGLPAAAISEAVTRLCASGRLVRLMTLVESFALPAWSIDRAAAGPTRAIPLHDTSTSAVSIQ